MNSPAPADAPPSFDDLTPDAVLAAVEAGLGARLEAMANPLPSYVNRVYGLMTEDGRPLVAKFYRPGRWSLAALQEEQTFVAECAAAEIPVVSPLPLKDGATLGCSDGIWFSVFPRRGGRPFDADTDGVWRRLGSLLGRVHAVGAGADAPHRRDLHPEGATLEDLRFLIEGGFMSDDEAGRLEAISDRLLQAAAPCFDEVEPIRLHGDCQRTNVLDREAEGLMLIDFDDMMNGPAVQDLWLLLPETPDACSRQIGHFLAAYETFLPFDRRTLGLIEPLRAMRMIHYLAWCARQADDYSFQLGHPDWGSETFWRAELRDLEQQVERL